MAKKKKNTAATKAAILCVCVGVPALFILMSMGTNTLMERVPYVGVGLIVLIIDIYTAMTCSLLYKYFEASTPFDAYIPCVGELSMMDVKYKRIGYVFYVIALITLGLSQLPYTVFSFLGDNAAMSMPHWMMVVCFVALGIIQVIKGLGILNLTKTIEEEWNDKVTGSLGFIKSFSWLGFIPFVRVVATYGLNKPLSTLVSFNNMSVSDTNEVEIEEED